MDPVFRDKQKKVWKEELEEIERKGQSFCRSTRRCRRSHKSCKVFGISGGTTSRRLEIVKKCKRSVKSGRKGKHIRRRASEPCRKGPATLGKRQQSWKIRSRTCRQGKREEAAVRRNPMDGALIQPRWSNSSQWEQPRQCSSSPVFQGEVSRVCGGQHRPEPTAPERGAGKRRKLGKKNGMMRG